MSDFAYRLETLIASGNLSYERSDKNPDISSIVMLNEFNQDFDAMIFFKLDESEKIHSVFVVTKNDINGENRTFTYSVGYYVQESSRGSGKCKELVNISIEELESFLSNNGPNYDIGADDSFNYVLESVVSIENEPSNKIASSLLHDGSPVVKAKEYRSQEESNVYRLELENRSVC
ncbi:hypothetical protein J4N42_18570 [Vibrio sp. SCSIO 43135]|uniref:hypothetical protein n=1 Tax=Vibrio sp. SCSIO 43135 TaxID=2819096 RepID=UPI0020759D72|nr:hypothetical protein [Vibrio sp. SCSIO 43135]USD42640.1 hypothetical protein J4N42_18570 [Vibrio sp. SCSIO 43135]